MPEKLVLAASTYNYLCQTIYTLLPFNFVLSYVLYEPLETKISSFNLSQLQACGGTCPVSLLTGVQ